ncbi:MAG: hypothetical protein AAGK98_08935 [Pseudomonadota bacterium]
MSKSKFAFIALAAIALPTGVFADITQNNFSIELEDTSVTQASFTDVSGWTITAGQLPSQEAISVVFDSKDNPKALDFIVPADRKNSSTVADTYVGWTAHRVANGHKSGTDKPGSMNFAFQGTLTLNSDSFSNFSIGQQGGDFSNNWWIGVSGQAGSGDDNGKANLCLTGQSGTVYQMMVTGQHNVKVKALSGSETCGSSS